MVPRKLELVTTINHGIVIGNITDDIFDSFLEGVIEVIIRTNHKLAYFVGGDDCRNIQIIWISIC